MYNMEISIGSYKFRVEILIAIVVVSWIMFGHLLCGCSRVSLMEGMALITETMTNPSLMRSQPKTVLKSGMTNLLTEGFASYGNQKAKEAKEGFASGIYQREKDVKEGFVGSNNSAMGPEFADARTPSYIMDPNKWSMPTLTYSPGTRPDAGVQSILDRPKQPVPLPEGQMDMFATTPFAPECCPNAYSSSTGCACMTMDQYTYLQDRGGNNVPYSEY